jgi:hypothetical protein
MMSAMFAETVEIHQFMWCMSESQRPTVLLHFDTSVCDTVMFHNERELTKCD